MRRLKPKHTWKAECLSQPQRIWANLPSNEMYIIQCQLITVDFDNNVEGVYSALSYEWGPDEPPYYWIQLNKRYLRVRKNLYSFLRAAHLTLSKRESGGYLWVDAICIDQENTLERGHQVRQMAEIYSRAKSVLAWLGPYVSKDIEAASGDLLQLGQVAEDLVTSKKQIFNWDSFLEKAGNLFHDRSKAFLAFAEICKTTYWTRMWIFQEILSAKKAWLILGDHWFSWEMVERLFYSSNIFEEEVSNNPTMQIVEELSKTLFRNRCRRSICDTVNAFRHGICSDSRDRVFAILGLVQSGKWFPVTYSSTKEELFCSVIFASYVNAPTQVKSPTEAGSHPQLFSVSPARFFTKRANTDALIEISEVSTALGVSFVALANYLTTRPNLAVDTLFIFRAWHSVTTELSDGVVEHKYDVLEDEDSRFLRIELTLRVQADGRQWLNFETLSAAIADPDKPDSKSLTYTSDSAYVEGSLVLGSSSLLIPFAAFIFLVGAVHKVLNLHEDHVRIIKAKGAYTKSEPDMGGKTYTMLDLSSVALQ
jgi:hypothetical protein